MSPLSPPNLSGRCGVPAGSLLGAVPCARATTLPPSSEKQEKGRGARGAADPPLLSLPRPGAPHSRGALAATTGPPQPAPSVAPSSFPTPPFQHLACPPGAYGGTKPHTLPYPLPALPPLSTYSPTATPHFSYGQQ